MRPIERSDLAPFIHDIAFVAGTEPATSRQEFIDQLNAAARTLRAAQVSRADYLQDAAKHLADAMAEEEGMERCFLLTRALRYLNYTPDLIDELRQHRRTA